MLFFLMDRTRYILRNKIKDEQDNTSHSIIYFFMESEKSACMPLLTIFVRSSKLLSHDIRQSFDLCYWANH